MSNFSTLDLVDRKRLISRPMTLVGEDHEVHQRGKERLELVELLPAEAGVEHGFDAADYPGGGHRAGGRLFGQQFLCLRLQAASEFVHQLDTPPNCRGAGRPRLDDHRSRRLRLAAGKTKQGLQAEADSVTPDLASLAGCGVDLLPQAFGARVEGGKEAVLLIGEMLVEGGPGYARPVNHVLDVRSEVTKFGSSFEHRYDQSLPLDRSDQVRGKLAHSRRELATAVGEQIEGGLDLLGGPIITDRREEGLLAQLDSIRRHRVTQRFRLKTTQVLSRYQTNWERVQ